MVTQEQLIIQLGAAPGAAVQWLPTDATGQALGTVQTGTLGEAAAMAADRRVVAFFPAEQLILTEVVVPGLRGPRLRQAVPYALEDRVASDIDALHFAYDRPDADGRIEVAVIERELLDRWLAEFRAAGMVPAALVPDCLGLPWLPGETEIAITRDRALLRDGPAAGFACERALLEPMLSARGAATAQRVVVADDAPIPPAIADVPALRLSDGLLPWLAPQAAQPALNLLQGDYAPATRRKLDLGRWKLPAALATAWLVLVVVGWGARYIATGVEYRESRAEVRATFERVMPGEPFVDPRLQIERRLAGSSATGGEALQMLATVSDGLSGVRGVRLGAINYRRGLLELTITAQRAEQLDQLRDRLASEGRYSVSIESASSRGEQVEGRMQLRSTGR